MLFYVVIETISLEGQGLSFYRASAYFDTKVTRLWLFGLYPKVPLKLEHTLV